MISCADQFRPTNNCPSVVKSWKFQDSTTDGQLLEDNHVFGIGISLFFGIVHHVSNGIVLTLATKYVRMSQGENVATGD